MENKVNPNLIIESFNQLEFRDPDSAINLKYNLFTPSNYVPDKSYPLLVFIHDAGAVSADPRTTLTQGIGATIWATASEQEKHACFVLAPQFSRIIVNDQSEATAEVDAMINLVKSVRAQFNIDHDRIYTTGQSMGCMASIAMMIKNLDLFAAALLVAGQWDAKMMSVLTKANMWIIVAEGDTKAFPGMNASMAALEARGARISRASWNGQASEAEFGLEISKMISEGSNIKYSVLQKGTVVPADQPENGGSNHVNTWRIAYRIEGLRDWLFTQEKTQIDKIAQSNSQAIFNN